MKKSPSKGLLFLCNGKFVEISHYIKTAEKELTLSIIRMEEMLGDIEKNIGYTFGNKGLLKQALTHSSYSNEMKINKLENYQRLEFLGDAVLELISSNFLYEKFKEMQEGQLSKLRASLVCEPVLASCARALKLEEYYLLGKGEEATGGRKKDSIACDIIEAVIGAIYKDGGLEEAEKFIFRAILVDIENRTLFSDSKSALQEYAQSKLKDDVQYKLVHSTGPEHNKQFFVEVFVGKKLLGKGAGKSKKAAEQEAAYQALILLQDKG